MIIKRILASSVLAAGFLLIGAGSAWAATCNVTHRTPASDLVVRGTVTISWGMSSNSGGTGNCEGALIEIIKPNGGGTVSLGIVNLPAASTTWNTTSGSYADGAGYTISLTPVPGSGDSAGQAKTITGLTVDNTAPTIAFASRTAPNVAGWNSTDVTLTWNCSDAVGVLSSTVTQPLTTEGSSLSSTGTCTDTAGNTASNTQTGIMIDKTAPGISSSGRTPAANGAGWNNSDVTLTWTCTDALSGPVSASVSQIVSTEGAGQSSAGTCSDAAGNNTVSDPQTGVSIDKTAPGITYVGQAPAANGAGWNNTNVTLTWACADTLSGPFAPSTDAEIALEGADQSISGTCSDAAGNSASDIQGGIDIDLTGPSVAFAGQTPVANDAGWNNTAVDLAWTCADGLSGVASSDLTDTLSAEGTDQGGTGTCTDAAGNSASDSAGVVDIDRTDPSVAYVGQDPVANDAGWNNTSVTLTWTCADGLSGVASSDLADTLSEEGTDQGGTGACTDAAGNSASDGAGVVDIDLTDPQVAYIGQDPAANDAGWNNTNVTLTWACTDSLSGPWAPSTDAEIAIEGEDQSTSGTCTDAAGNSASDTQTGIDIDLTVPSVAYVGQDPVANGDGWNNTAVTLSWTCSDDLSGPWAPATDAVIALEGAAQSISGTCTDAAGNSALDTQGGIDIDLTDPSVAFAGQDPVANDAGWNNTSVDLAWTCADGLSGVASSDLAHTLSEQGTDQGGTGTCSDAAGNSASDIQSGVDIDLTAPSVAFAGQEPVANNAGWNNTAVTLSWTCADDLSGVASSDLADTLSEQGTDQGGTGTCTDAAGNSASDSAGVVDIDLTDPSVAYVGQTPVANDAGWNNTSVNLAWTCADGLSGVASSDLADTLAAEGADQGGTGTCSDVAGNSALDVRGGVDIDLTAPSVSGGVNPAPNTAGWNNSDATIHFSCVDPLSGIATCTSDRTLTTETIGQTVTGTVVDQAGNSKSASVKVKIDKTGATTTILAQTPTVIARAVRGSVDVVSRDNLSGVAGLVATLTNAVTGEIVTLTPVCSVGCGTLLTAWAVALPTDITPGAYTFWARSADVAGALGSPKTVTMVVV